MKLSIFTTLSDPKPRGDAWKPAFKCYKELADQFVVVDGSKEMKPDSGFDTGDMKVIVNKWPKEFGWEFIGQQFQRGYEACTGDVVIRADLDMIFHEQDYGAIRLACDEMLQGDRPAISFYKRQFIQPDRYNVKSRLVIAVNKARYKDRIRFDGGRDLCQPTFDGIELSPERVRSIRIPIWNYECLLKTKKQLLEDKGRFARAWQRTFGEYKLGGPDDESAYNKWLEMMVGRYKKPHEVIPLEAHPKVIQETIKNLKPENFGYSGFGLRNG